MDKMIIRKRARKILTPDVEEQLVEAVLDRGMSLEEAVAEVGFGSVQIAKIAIAKEEGRREAFANPLINEAELSMNARQKLAVAARRREKEFEYRVHVEARRRQEEISLPHYFERLNKIEKLLDSRKGVFTPEEYKKILFCLHPDGSPGETQKGEAFRIFNEKKMTLVSLPSQAASKTGLPRTLAEMLARRKVKR